MVKINNLNKKVGKLLVVGFEGKTMPDHVKTLIHDYHIGGIILFTRNIGTPKEIIELTQTLQLEAKHANYTHPLLICIDQENGVVRRLGEGTSVFPGAMSLGATNNANNAYKIGLATGLELKHLGINWNLAPVLDINNNPDNPVINVRSYGESPDKVAEFGSSAMKGMQDAGLITTLKHFPGHGDTSADSHYDLPTITHNLDRLEKVELVPFKRCINEGADVVMSAHVYFPTLEPREGIPATISEIVITGLLRNKMDFDRVITTDCMEMQAISETIGTGKGAVEAIKAGVDLVMISHSFDKQMNAISEIISAVESGKISETLIDQANQRINRLKDKYLSWDEISTDKKLNVPDSVGSEMHKKLARKIYRQSITIVKNDGIFPLKNNSKVLVIDPQSKQAVGVEDRIDRQGTLSKAIQVYDEHAKVYQLPHTLTELEIDNIISKAVQYDTVIIGVLSISKGSNQVDLIKKMCQQNLSVIVIGMRSPYSIKQFPNVPAYINTYETSYPALEVTIGAIYGKEIVTGKTPVTINGFQNDWL